jgi:hypothetical protein
MLKGEIYENTNDQTKIEYVDKITHRVKTDNLGRQSKVKLDEDILKFKYIEAVIKKGEVEFKRSEFERLVKQKMFVKC